MLLLIVIENHENHKNWFSTKKKQQFYLKSCHVYFDCTILNKLVNALKCIIRAVEMIIKWLVSSVFSINIAQADFFFVSEVLATPTRYLDSRLILLSRMQHNIATA